MISKMLGKSALLTCFLLALVSSSSFGQQTCEADHQCSSDRFCYEARVCAPCIVCAAYNRHQGKNACARAWQGCGSCLNGFVSEDLPGLTQRGNCIVGVVMDTLQPTVAKRNMTTNVSQNMQIAIVVVIVLSLGSGGIYFVIKGRQRVRGPSPDIECGRQVVQVVQETRLLQHSPKPNQPPPPGQHSPPPDYSQFEHAHPSAPPTQYQDEVTMTLVISQQCEEKLQQARPLHVPDNHIYHWDSIEEEVVLDDAGEEADDESERSTPDNLAIDDNTQPSDWTPGNQNQVGSRALDNSGACNDSESPSSSVENLDTQHRSPNFHGMFVNGTLVRRAGPPTAESSEVNEAGERPAKRMRGDSGSHSNNSHSSDDESQPEAPASGNVANISCVGE